MSTDTALAFVLPEELQENIQKIRKNYDKAYGRWPPHINFFFPFIYKMQIDEGLVKQIKDALVDIKPFKVEFDHISYFNFGKDKPITIWLGPQDPKPFEKPLFPRLKSKYKNFTPHLTLAQKSYFQFKKCQEKFMKQIGQIECEVDSIQILTNDYDKVFKPLWTIYFGGKEPVFNGDERLNFSLKFFI